MATAQLIQVAVFLAAAAIAAPLGRSLRMGSVLGYLAAGVIIGPFVLGPYYALDDVDNILHFGEFGVVMLLFVIGLELRPVRLWAMRSAIFGLGTAQLIITGIVLAAIGIALGLTAGQALFIGLALVALLDRVCAAGARGEGRAHHPPRQARLLRAAVPGPRRHPADRSRAALRARRRAAQHGFQIRSSRHPHHCRRDRGGALPAEPALPHRGGDRRARGDDGERAADGGRRGAGHGGGRAIGGARRFHRRRAARRIPNTATRSRPTSRPFEGLLLAVFFIAVGMSIDLGVLVARPAALAAIVVGLVLIKAIILYALGRWWGLDSVAARRLGLVISQGGEFAFVLFGAGALAGVIDQSMANLLDPRRDVIDGGDAAAASDRRYGQPRA